jgi:tetratricopeptide (TPR) repeat protein
MKTTVRFLILSILILPAFLYAQETDIIPYLKQIEQGKADEVKLKLPELKKEYPQSSNVMFLEGVLTENGQDAISIYQNIVDKYPKSSYADAALYRIYSYYFALGLYNTADKNFEKLKKDYPESPYIKIATQNVADQKETSNQITEKNDEADYKYTVQAGAFTNKDNASALQKEFINSGMYSVMKEKNVGGTVFNVVYVGRFVNRSEAEDFKSIVNSQFNISGRVVEIEK